MILKKIKVLTKEPGKPAEVRFMDNSLVQTSKYQDSIKMECAFVKDRPAITVYFNKDGKLDYALGKAKVNVHLTNKDGEVYDVACGNVMFTRIDEEGHDIDLTDEDIAAICDKFSIEEDRRLNGEDNDKHE